MAIGIVMPKAGNSVEECVLSQWRISVGDSIKVGQIIADIETDKSAIEVESTAEGTVLALFGNVGDLIPVLQNIVAVGNPGEAYADLAPDGAGIPPLTETAPVAETAPAVSVPAAGVASIATANGPLSPRARKFLADHPFVVPALTGSGPNGRILEKDLQEAFQNAPRLSPVAAAMQSEGVQVPASGSGMGGMIVAADMGKKTAPVVAPTSPAAASVAVAVTGEDIITEKPFTHIRKIIAGRLQESLSSMAQYTLNAEADVSGLLALRNQIKDHGEKLGLANINLGDMVMFALIKALQKHPEMNGEFANNVVKLHSAVHIGFACDTPRGLMVPVLHHAQRLSLGQMCTQVKAMAKQANEGSISPDNLSGATFTVSNLGALGITTFTPVISAPQLAILGVGKTLLRPIREADGSIGYRDYMQFSLTINHMVVDGAPGARFLQTLKNIIENFALVCVAG